MNKTEPRILKAATRVFGRKGVSGATTREIAQAAKVNEVTLFRCFRSKNELLRQVILQKSRRYEDFFARAPFETPDDLRRTVESFALTYVASLRENEQFLRTFFGEMHRHLKLCRQLFVESSESMRFKLMNYLIAAQKKGLVRADLDVATGTDALTGMLVIGILRRPLTARVYSNERFTKTCVELFLKGIEP